MHRIDVHQHVVAPFWVDGLQHKNRDPCGGLSKTFAAMLDADQALCRIGRKVMRQACLEYAGALELNRF